MPSSIWRDQGSNSALACGVTEVVRPDADCALAGATMPSPPNKMAAQTTVKRATPHVSEHESLRPVLRCDRVFRFNCRVSSVKWKRSLCLLASTWHQAGPILPLSQRPLPQKTVQESQRAWISFFQLSAFGFQICCGRDPQRESSAPAKSPS